MRKSGGAFSLIELMAVLAVISVLVAIALPRFEVFIARSRQSEAVSNLGIIHKLQKSYNLYHQGKSGRDDVWYDGVGTGGPTDNDNNLIMGRGSRWGYKCADRFLENDLGFRVEDCTKLRYLYKAMAGYDQALNHGASHSSVSTTLPSIYPGCGDTDMWELTRGKDSNTPANESYQELRHTSDVIKKCKD